MLKEIRKKENKNNFNEIEMELVLSEGRKKAWAAEVKGLDEKYELSRTFLEAERDGLFVSYFLEEGKIYNWYEGKDQVFGAVDNGRLYEISKSDVINLLNRGKENEIYI